MFRSTRQSLNREVSASLKWDAEEIRNTVAEGEFTVGRERGTFRIVSGVRIVVTFNFNGFPTSMWSKIKSDITAMVVKSAASAGYHISASYVTFK